MASLEHAWQLSAPNQQRPIQSTELASVFWQPFELLLWTLHKKTKIDGLKYAFLTQEKLLQHRFGNSGSERLQVSEGAGSSTSLLHSLWHFF